MESTSSSRIIRRKQVASLKIQGKICPLYQGLNLIGRLSSATVLLPQPQFSKLHAIISAVNDKEYYISDNKSVNGTCLNGEILTPYLFYKIEDGAKIKIATSEGIFNLKNPQNTGNESSRKSENIHNDTTIAPSSDDFHEAETQVPITVAQSADPKKSTDTPIELEDDFLNMNSQMYDDVFASETFRLSLIKNNSNLGVIVDETILTEADKNPENKEQKVEKTIIDTSDSETSDKECVKDLDKNEDKKEDSDTDIDATQIDLDFILPTQDSSNSKKSQVKFNVEPSKNNPEIDNSPNNFIECQEELEADDENTEDIDLLEMPNNSLTENSTEKSNKLTSSNKKLTQETQMLDVPQEKHNEKNLADDEEIDLLAPTQPLQIQNTNIEVDFLAPTQPLTQNLTRKLVETNTFNNNEQEKTSEVDFLAATQPLTQNFAEKSKQTEINKNVNQQEEEYDLLAPTQPLFKPVDNTENTSNNEEVEMDLLAQTQPICPSKTAEKSSDNIEENEIDLLAPTQQLNKSEIKASRSSDTLPGDENDETELINKKIESSESSSTLPISSDEFKKMEESLMKNEEVLCVVKDKKSIEEKKPEEILISEKPTIENKDGDSNKEENICSLSKENSDEITSADNKNDSAPQPQHKLAKLNILSSSQINRQYLATHQSEILANKENQQDYLLTGQNLNCNKNITRSRSVVNDEDDDLPATQVLDLNTVYSSTSNKKIKVPASKTSVAASRSSKKITDSSSAKSINLSSKHKEAVTEKSTKQNIESKKSSSTKQLLSNEEYDDDLPPTQPLCLESIQKSSTNHINIKKSGTSNTNQLKDDGVFSRPVVPLSKKSSKVIQEDDDDDLPPTQVLCLDSIPKTSKENISSENTSAGTFLMPKAPKNVSAKKKSEITNKNADDSRKTGCIVKQNVVVVLEKLQPSELKYLNKAKCINTIRNPKNPADATPVMEGSEQKKFNKKTSRTSNINNEEDDDDLPPTQVLILDKKQKNEPVNNDDIFDAPTQKLCVENNDTGTSKQPDESLAKMLQFFDKIEQDVTESTNLETSSNKKAQNRKDTNTKTAVATAKKPTKAGSKKRVNENITAEATPEKKIKLVNSKKSATTTSKRKAVRESSEDSLSRKSRSCINFDDETSSSSYTIQSIVSSEESSKSSEVSEKRKYARKPKVKVNERASENVRLEQVKKTSQQSISSESETPIVFASKRSKCRRIDSSSSEESVESSVMGRSRNHRSVSEDSSTTTVTSCATKSTKSMSTSLSRTTSTSTASSDEVTPRKRLRNGDSSIQISTSGVKHKVVFTMICEPNLENKVEKLGGSMVETVQEATVLVTSKITRTLKFLTAVSLGKPIANIHWIKESYKANRFLDPWNFLVQDSQVEKKYEFTLRESLLRATKKKLFQGYTIVLAVSKNAEPLKELIEICGGKCLLKVSGKQRTDNTIVISFKEDTAKYSKYLKQQPPLMVVDADAIFGAALKQQINWDEHLLH